jgi:lipid-A-disaccharide synthase
MKYSDILWVCSGTATLEAAIIGTPLILLYKTGKLTYFLGRLLYRLKHIGMPNIVLNKTVMPELVQSQAGVFNLVTFTEKIENDIDNVRDNLKAVGEFFPDADTFDTGAVEISSFMENMNRENSAK